MVSPSVNLSLWDVFVAYMESNPHGYTGLYNEERDCACHKGCLVPCGEVDLGECKLGYSTACGTCAKVATCDRICANEDDETLFDEFEFAVLQTPCNVREEVVK